MTEGDLVRICQGRRAGMTGTVQRIGVADAYIKMTSTGLTVAVPLVWLRVEDARPMDAADAREQVAS